MDYCFINKYTGGNITETVVERVFFDLQEEKISG